ncbi:HDOD domain-containing protein [Sinimarinibacterium sp. NLF-5-8]|uniref:HDOD domain-containing protein n=1 Tax=Sinimarinibacterium sp. NLF-5-8 TaxID=2698684 RepID=UPI00137BE37B|nr:HDOD domain-containing protein [Sinimarinibacterium sp. NLF-5-8]QHS08771.1 HDOD domain-containing protein [Sinimarinibacterium sp. NLF-5-8]
MQSQDRLYRAVVDALARDRLTLPTLPEVALGIRRLLRQEDRVTAARLADEIMRDPAIAVRLLRVANSAALRGGNRADTVQQAVARLGFEYTRMLVDGLALEQMFEARIPLIHSRMQAVWQESLRVAALARALAEQCTVLRCDQAMLAGLVYQVGALPILKMAEKQFADVQSAEALDHTLETLAPRIGRVVLQAWDFPQELVDVPAQWPDVARTHGGAADYADVIAVAVFRLRGRDDALPAYQKLDLEPGFELGAQGPLQGAFERALELLQVR